MKKAALIFLCLTLIIMTAACIEIRPATSATGDETTAAEGPFDTTAAPSDTIATTAATVISPTNTAKMYSSYAHMVSYDPASGWADFDYFDMLRGDDAVQYLVDYEGYTLADAQAEVNAEAGVDSIFWEKNINPQLRTVDMNVVEIKLMFNPDGSQVMGAEPVNATPLDLYNLYDFNPDAVLNQYFYYVTVVGNDVTKVEQVYWP